METDQQQLQFLGLLGIYNLSFKLIFNCRKIFTQLTLTLILPLCALFLAYQQLSEFLYSRIQFNQFMLVDTRTGTPTYHKLSDLLSAELAIYIFLKVASYAFLLALSLLSTAAVVYTIDAVYASREVTFQTVMTIVPRVWKRLIVTFLCAFLVIACYNLIFGAFIMFVWRITVADDDYSVAGAAAFLATLGLYATGFVYITILWQVASVVSVLEESSGFRAMIKSRVLIKGKTVVASIVFFKLVALLAAMDLGFRVVVLRGIGELKMIGYGGTFAVVMAILVLFGLVAQSVIYFVCKSYHHETIDKSALSEHLEVYLAGDYVALKSRDVQMQDYRL